MAQKKLTIKVMVSLPRAGEFVAELTLDPAHVLSCVDANGPATFAKQDLDAYVYDTVTGNLKVKVASVELARVVKALKAYERDES